MAWRRRDELRRLQRGDARAPHDAHLGFGGEHAVAAHEQPRRGRCAEPPFAQQLFARRAFDDLQGDALAQAFDLAPGLAHDAGRGHGAVDAQQEVLVFVDQGARGGLGLHDGGRAGVEAELLRAFKRADQRLPRSDGAQRTGHAKR